MGDKWIDQTSNVAFMWFGFWLLVGALVYVMGG